MYEQILRFCDHVQIEYMLFSNSKALLGVARRITSFIACNFVLFLKIADIKTTSIMLTALMLEF